MTDIGSARVVILERIRAALVDGPQRVEVPRAYERALPAEVDRIALFAERVADYRAVVERCRADAVAAAIGAVLTRHGARRVVVPPGLPSDWLSAYGWPGVTWIGDEPPLAHGELDASEAVVTGCAVAIAETGTIVLDTGAGQGRRALSLLPDLHVCVVEADRIVGTVPEALSRLDPGRPLTWISGPSATSDIELQRVEGVHGPRRLHVLIIDGP